MQIADRAPGMAAKLQMHQALWVRDLDSLPGDADELAVGQTDWLVSLRHFRTPCAVAPPLSESAARSERADDGGHAPHADRRVGQHR